MAAAAALLALAGCGGSVPHAPAAHRPSLPASTASAASAVSAGSTVKPPGAAFCARLEAAPAPETVYASEVVHQVDLASGGGSASPGDIAAARAVVALWITISCPQFTYLTKSG